MKREERTSDEEMLLMRTLRDFNLSKFVVDDVRLFMQLIKDIFPRISDPPKKTYPDLMDALKVSVKEANLVYHEDWIKKCVQLYETSLVRHGYMVVGTTGSGKSTLEAMLTEALGTIDVQTKIIRMNPKAITAEEMYGKKDPISDEWTEGVFSAI